MIRNIPVVACALACAIGFSQIPVYVQQYEQRLGGAVDELARVVEKDTESARGLNMDLGAYIQRHELSTDPAFAKTGDTMRGRSVRLARLKSALDTLTAARPWEKPFVLLRDAEAGVAARAWEAFGFTLSLDPWYGLSGLLVGMFLWDFLSWLGRALFGRRRTALPR